MSDIQPPSVPSTIEDILTRLDSLERSRPSPVSSHLITVPGVVTPSITSTDEWDPWHPSTLVEFHTRIDQVDSSDVSFVVKRDGTTVGTSTITAGKLTSPPTRIDPGILFSPLDHSLRFEVSDAGSSEWTSAQLQARLACREPIGSAILPPPGPPKAWCGSDLFDGLASEIQVFDGATLTDATASYAMVLVRIKVSNFSGGAAAVGLIGHIARNATVLGNYPWAWTETIPDNDERTSFDACVIAIAADDVITYQIENTAAGSVDVKTTMTVVEVDSQTAACCVPPE